jgi:DNA-binding LacI/PurR family transcriptional regulator
MAWDGETTLTDSETSVTKSAATADQVTMSAVAVAANVSVPTVSKVINQSDDVAPETRLRVQAAIAELGYQKRPRVGSRPRVIDLVFTEFSPWATEILRGASETALHGERRVAVSALNNEEDVDRWLGSLTPSNTEGVIVVLTELSARQVRQLRRTRVPVVAIDTEAVGDLEFLTIGSSNWAGGLAATEHLLELGHRKIATITGKPELLLSQARLDGYRAALERAGVEIDQQLIVAGDFHYESALGASLALLDLPDPPTAIFAASDVTAMGVYEAARRYQMRIPEDLSVVGFDDVPMAQWMSPPLTTLRAPLAEMAALATRALLDPGAFAFEHRLEFATKLVVRSSTQPPRDAGGTISADPAASKGPQPPQRPRRERKTGA